jgi:hypothetical protein
MPPAILSFFSHTSRIIQPMNQQRKPKKATGDNQGFDFASRISHQQEEQIRAEGQVPIKLLNRIISHERGCNKNIRVKPSDSL